MKHIDIHTLRRIDKAIAYSVCYGAISALQTRIDEEGSGAFFAAAAQVEAPPAALADFATVEARVLASLPATPCRTCGANSYGRAECFGCEFGAS